MILIKMKEITKSLIDKTILNEIITFSTYFNESQRQTTKDSGTITWLNIIRIINESTSFSHWK